MYTLYSNKKKKKTKSIVVMSCNGQFLINTFNRGFVLSLLQMFSTKYLIAIIEWAQLCFQHDFNFLQKFFFVFSKRSSLGNTDGDFFNDRVRETNNISNVYNLLKIKLLQFYNFNCHVSSHYP